MQSSTQVNAHLKQIGNSCLKAFVHDPTTLYLNDAPFDRDAFKQLKKEGFIELNFQDRLEKRYALSSRGKELLNRA